MTHQPATNRWRANRVRPADVWWLLLFAALAFLSPHRDAPEFEVLAGLAVTEVVLPRIAWFRGRTGTWVLILLRLLLAWLFIGLSGAIASSFYPLLLIPIVAAATTLGALGTSAVTLLACAAYLSFLLFLDERRYFIPPAEVRELAVRALFLVLGGYLTFRQAAEAREAAQRSAAAAEALARANADLQAAEEQVRRADRLAALGQLTAGLAHELRNPLGTIRGSAELLQRSAAADPLTRELAGYIAADVDRTNALVSRFLDFARPLAPQREPHELAEILDAAVNDLTKQREVSVVRNYSADLPLLSLDPALFRQAIFNLLQNATDASPAGGVITLRTRLLTDAVEIAVIDRGTGIPTTDTAHIFNPFFTTKPDGVGLGLAIVAKIVDEHGGTITTDSTPGEGATFRILLPRP